MEARWGGASEEMGGVGKGGGLGMPFGCCLRMSFGTLARSLSGVDDVISTLMLRAGTAYDGG